MLLKYDTKLNSIPTDKETASVDFVTVLFRLRSSVAWAALVHAKLLFDFFFLESFLLSSSRF